MREILAFDVEENISARVDLEDLAFSALEYQASVYDLPAKATCTMQNHSRHATCMHVSVA